jgi:hypothetical protein
MTQVESIWPLFALSMNRLCWDTMVEILALRGFALRSAAQLNDEGEGGQKK